MQELLQPWVLFTLFAASMQAVRTAAQKDLSAATSPMAATTARYWHGWPFALAYCLAMVWVFGLPDQALTPRFFVSAFLAGVCQILATLLLVRMFSLRNFAVANTYIKAEALMTATVGSLFFAESLSAVGWLAIFVAFVGLVFLSAAKQGWVRPWTLITEKSALYGLAASVLFALTSLLLRDASLTIEHESRILRASFVLLTMISMQGLLCLAWAWWRAPHVFSALAARPRLASFVGLTSMAGSVGWFTAMAMTNASYVKTLGQIELLIMMGISLFYFRERPTRLEWVGFCVLLSGILLLLLER